MPKAAHAPSPQIAHVVITLKDVVPEVSRIVAVPLGIRLDMLHLIIQAAMGWTNSHLWLIHARGCTWGVPDPDFPDDTILANRTLLLDMIADIGTNRFEYIYDFGDHWSHTVRIVKPMPAVPGIAYPLLIDAVGRCPLEDSGGPPGYNGSSRRLQLPQCVTQSALPNPSPPLSLFYMRGSRAGQRHLAGYRVQQRGPSPEGSGDISRAHTPATA
jgi:hypothetical protein